MEGFSQSAGDKEVGRGGAWGEGSERERESGRGLRKAEMKMSLKEFNVSPQDTRVLNYLGVFFTTFGPGCLFHRTVK